MDEDLRLRLKAMAARDLETRARLAADGSLFDGYNDEMRAVHEANAGALDVVLAQRGWPGASIAGEDGAEAAWLVAQHAIGLPDFQRRCLAALEAAAAAGEAPPWQPAMLLDRIRVMEGRPQLYGSSFDWDEAGEMSPRPIAEPDGVDARRAAVGLPPLAETMARLRRDTAADPRPADLAARQAEIHAWAVRVGWRRA